MTDNISIKLEQGASRAIGSAMDEKNEHRPLRIDLQFTGCCDSSLCLRVDDAFENDLISQIEGLTFVIRQEIYDLTGEITVSYVNHQGRKGYIIKSSKPLSEWEGFGVSDIKF